MSWENKTGINFMIFILIYIKNLSVIRCFTCFSMLLRTGSNPADINRFESHTGMDTLPSTILL